MNFRTLSCQLVEDLARQRLQHAEDAELPYQHAIEHKAQHEVMKCRQCATGAMLNDILL